MHALAEEWKRLQCDIFRLMFLVTGVEVHAVWVLSCCWCQLMRGRGVQKPHDHLCRALHQRICRGEEAAGQERGAGACARSILLAILSSCT